MKVSIFLLAFLAVLLPQVAGAGQSCEEHEATADNLRRTFELALETRKNLETSGAKVAILARAGQDLSRWGLSWSHAGIAWRDNPSGRWIVTHLLNECGTALSGIYEEGLANFFSDAPVRWEVLVIVPPPETQDGIAAVLAGDAPLRMHEPAYSTVAYPFATRYQNSNQWILEVAAESLAGRSFSSRAEAQRWLQDNGYRATTLNIPTLTRLGGRMFRANVAFDDHPPERRWAGRIDTVTVESLATFFADRGATRLRLAANPGSNGTTFSTTFLK